MEMNDAKLIEFTHIPPEAGVWRQVLDSVRASVFARVRKSCTAGKKANTSIMCTRGKPG